LPPEKSFRTFSNRFFCVILLVVMVIKLLDRHSPEQVEVAVVERRTMTGTKFFRKFEE
jgi:hypothetical protein